MKIGIACDHTGYILREKIINYLSDKVTEIVDFGTDNANSVDYPDFAHSLAQSLLDGEIDRGILICGSGNGINMSVNKWRDIRSALAWNPEIARLARLHNDANVLCLPARFIEDDIAFECVNEFIITEFEGGRHQNRVSKINVNM